MMNWFFFLGSLCICYFVAISFLSSIFKIDLITFTSLYQLFVEEKEIDASIGIAKFILCANMHIVLGISISFNIFCGLFSSNRCISLKLIPIWIYSLFLQERRVIVLKLKGLCTIKEPSSIVSSKDLWLRYVSYILSHHLFFDTYAWQIHSVF